ncbi:UNVERIFIED_ORG: hypothetical protein [Escherichia phage CMSTMSU]
MLAVLYPPLVKTSEYPFSKHTMLLCVLGILYGTLTELECDYAWTCTFRNLHNRH